MALTRAVVGAPIAAAPINAIIDEVEQTGLHAEFTSTSSVLASATVGNMGTNFIDVSKSNNTTFVTASLNTLTLVSPGIYDVTVFGVLSGVPTGQTFMTVSDGTNFARINGVTTSTSWGGPILAGYMAAASTVLTFTFYHTSAASRTINARILVTRTA